VLGGIDEFPLLREISRSSRATRSASSAFCVFSAAICASLRQHRHVTSALPGAVGWDYRWSAATCNRRGSAKRR
jgi:hypothetical protein